jgi:hypothetical protein
MRGVFGVEGRYRIVIKMADQKSVSRARDLTDGQKDMSAQSIESGAPGETPIRHSLDEGGRQMTGEALSTGRGSGHNWRINA